MSRTPYRWRPSAAGLVVLSIAFTLVAYFAVPWLRLAIGAYRTPTSVASAVSNAAIAGDYAYLAGSARGVGVLALVDGRQRWIPPPAPADRVDDVAVADHLLLGYGRDTCNFGE